MAPPMIDDLDTSTMARVSGIVSLAWSSSGERTSLMAIEPGGTPLASNSSTMSRAASGDATVAVTEWGAAVG